MRNKNMSKSDKAKPGKDKKLKRGFNMSSAKTSFSGNSQIKRKKTPKLLGSSSSITFGNIKMTNTNSSKLKTRVSTDISDCNDTQEKLLFIPSVETLNKKEISSFNLQKANQNMEIFMPSEPESVHSGFSARKKLKTSLINSPSYSEKKQDNSANKLSNISLTKLNAENFSNKNLNEIYLNNIAHNLNNFSKNDNYFNDEPSNYNLSGGINNNYITRSNENGLCHLRANSDVYKNNSNKNSNMEDYLIDLGFSSSVYNCNNFENDCRSRSKEKFRKNSNKENSEEFKNYNFQQLSKNVNLNNSSSENISSNNNINNNICNNNLLLIKVSESIVNNYTTNSFENNINYYNKSGKINNYNNNNTNDSIKDNNICVRENNNEKKMQVTEEEDFEMNNLDNKNSNINIKQNQNEKAIQINCDFASEERLQEVAKNCIINFNENEIFNNFYEIEETNSDDRKLKAGFDKEKISIPILIEDEGEEESNNFKPKLNQEVKFYFQEESNLAGKFNFKSSIFVNKEEKAKEANISLNNENNSNRNFMVIEENKDQNSHQKENELMQFREGEAEKIYNHIQFSKNINPQNHVNPIAAEDNLYFNFANVNSINYENVFVDNIYSNVDYTNIFNNANNHYSNNKQTQASNGMRITNVIRPHRKSWSEIERDFDENRYLHERAVNTYTRRNQNYMEKQGFVKPKMRKILLDWINEISSQLRFTRSTFHLSIALLDCFLSKHENLEVDKLQLTGVTCLLIAAKYEEILIPNIKDLANATNSACTPCEIVHQETLILKTLDWQINLTNFSTWINETTLCWDDFLSDIHIYGNELMLNLNTLKTTSFRANTIQSLSLFRAFTQYIDIISFDVEYLWYVDRILCLGVLYLLVLKCFELVDFSKFSYITMEHVSHLYEFNLLFDRFLNSYYSLEFVNIFDHIQYASCYFASYLLFDEVDLAEISHLEETLQIQTYNPHNFENDKQATIRKNELRRDTYANSSNNNIQQSEREE